MDISPFTQVPKLPGGTVPAAPLPHDGDKLKVGDSELAWHAVDTINYNVNLYHFAYALNRPTTNGIATKKTMMVAPTSAMVPPHFRNRKKLASYASPASKVRTSA